jgi:heptosyltransferase I
MHVLLIKTSSLGDVVHLFPALTDALQARPELRFDWVVERSYAALPRMHPGVEQVVPVALRQWRHALTQSSTWADIRAAFVALRRRRYDYVIDAQGLLKSTLLGTLSRGQVWGFDYASAREPLASLFYQRRVFVARDQHAIERSRKLLSHVLQYSVADDPPSYGIANHVKQAPATRDDGMYVLGLHGTSRERKEWLQEHWQELAVHLRGQGLRLLLPWGNERERLRAECIQRYGATVLPRLDYQGLVRVIGGAVAVVGVDTGLLHLGAALAKPVLALYPSTPPALTGALADRDSRYPVVNLAGAEALTVEAVLRALDSLLQKSGNA